MSNVYILGGAQTDFARNWHREGLDIYAMFREVLEAAVGETGLGPLGDVVSGWEAFCGFFVDVDADAWALVGVEVSVFQFW